MFGTRRTLVLAAVLLAMVLSSAPAGAEILRNDGYEDGGTVYFQGGFVAGETAAVRLVPSASGPQPLQDVFFLLGGNSSQVTITLNVWRDTGLAVPGSLLYTGDYLVMGSDDTFTSVDLSGTGIDADGGIWVGIEFQHSGYPSVCRDDDGITPDMNYIDASGFGWLESSLLGLTGDWVIRATALDPAGYNIGGTVSGLSGALALQNNGGDDLVLGSDGPYTFTTPLAGGADYDVAVILEPLAQDCWVSNGAGTVGGADVTDAHVDCIDEADVTGNDVWEPSQNLIFQAGFAPNEIAAARLTPLGAGSRQLTRVLFLYGGTYFTGPVTLHVWADDGGTLDPGTELYSAVHQLTGGSGMQSIDLTSEGITVDGDYRVGLEFAHFSLPSVGRDDDGLTAGRNFIYASTGTWFDSGTFGLTGDWVIRGVDVPAGGGDFAITSVADLPNDQGRQVRIAWEAAPDDSPGANPPVTEYALFRRVDDGFKSGAPDTDPALTLAYPPGDWDFLLTVPAFQEDAYSTIVPTVADSTIAEGMHWSVFFVRAMTASPGAFQDSPPDSGYSVDNLEPEAPQGLMATYSVVGTDLEWEPSADADFDYFRVYRGDAPGFPADPAHLVDTTTSQAWHDPAGAPGVHYRVSTVDFSGNESEAVAPEALVGAGDVPRGSVLSQNRPNPFNPATTIRFELANAGETRLAIHDSRGAMVRVLVAGPRGAGVHEVPWDGTDDRGRAVGSGVYYYRLQVGDEPPRTRRMSLVR